MMKTTALVLLLGAAIVIGLSCDGGEPEDTLTLEEYFAEMVAISDDVNNQNLSTLEGTFPPSTSEPQSDEERLESGREGMRQFASRIEDVVARYDGLAPPNAAAGHHDAYVKAVGDYTVAIEEFTMAEEYERIIFEQPSMEPREGEDMQDRLDAVKAFFASIDMSVLEGPMERLGDACRELMDLAEENGIEAEFCLLTPPDP
ncbi:MAG: hypothetical protein IIB88_10250 [Chloroflexi bacterium]|nr:hypothetical protein [Chloroflexota bacterium]